GARTGRHRSVRGDAGDGGRGATRSSTTPPARHGWTRLRGWIAGPPPTCCARCAPSASARSTERSPPGWRCATTADRASAPITTRPRSTSSAARSPAYHYEPETNGCVERFIQTLKEQILWIERFDTLEQLRARIRQ